ncbi:hypothetical protein V1511DRAFT_454291 [Dipodascopsis uninucleata]
MYAPIIARSSIRGAFNNNARQMILTRGFSSSRVARSGHWPEGPYWNIPFKVHNRKIPLAIPYTLFFLIPFLTPFGMAALAL